MSDDVATTAHFENRYQRELPDTYARVSPTPLKNPRWVAWNSALAHDLNWPHPPDNDLLHAFAGHGLLEGTKPIAQKYAGHQFGAFNPDLGDGRGLLLGEWNDGQGQHWDFHLKGAGKTPFSRFGDGRAVLRSSIREYLGSEALHGLGIPTTRALALVGSDEPVMRERLEHGAMLLRIAKTHIRFGHFEWFAFSGQTGKLEQLLNFCVTHLFTDCSRQPDPAAALFDAVTVRTAHLIAHWMSTGFCHGVMNTDNMSIIGDTFDYGPYAFLDAMQPGFICNHTDTSGRYAYNRQPDVAFWNLQCLAQALAGIADQSALRDSLSRFAKHYNERFLELMGARLGLATVMDEDQSLIRDWMQLASDETVDFHRPLRALAETEASDWATLDDDYVDRDRFRRFRQALAERRQQEPGGQTLALASNPVSILRTHHVQAVIDACEQGDDSLLHSYLAALQSPFDARVEWQRWRQLPPPDYQAQPLSCSS
ncbi:protein adenylyltransferase SelO [Saccharospirillum impatiens]|uniref:protein adenylyltransferase SelO n=1 Tax=Saccharospirillum impatiens TaxID=169438 RepID=UPI000425D4BF|nr:YdiU family protein [Saccharospirillum impatiens]